MQSKSPSRGPGYEVPATSEVPAPSDNISSQVKSRSAPAVASNRNARSIRYVEYAGCHAGHEQSILVSNHAFRSVCLDRCCFRHSWSSWSKEEEFQARCFGFAQGCWSNWTYSRYGTNWSDFPFRALLLHIRGWLPPCTLWRKRAPPKLKNPRNSQRNIGRGLHLTPCRETWRNTGTVH